MSYTIEIIDDLRAKLFEDARAELKAEYGETVPDSIIPKQLVEQRLQTLIMAGIGDPSNTERKTSPQIANLAANYLASSNDEIDRLPHAELCDDVRSLAASVLSQA